MVLRCKISTFGRNGKGLRLRIIGAILFLLFHGIEERIDTGIALLIGMLGYQERDTAMVDTIHVFLHHIVTHNLNISAILFLKEFTHQMGLRIKGDTMVDEGMLLEELLKNGIVILFFHVFI